MVHHICFPGLGIDCGNINPVAFSIFGKNIMWYGIIIAAGFVLAVFYASRRAKSFGLCQDNIFDFILLAAPLAIICARAYYVIFNFAEYKDNLADVVKIWNGGIAIYGAIIGGFAAAVIFCGIARVRLLPMLDICSLGLLIGQSVGRWGNFINAEAYGAPTSLPWRMVIYNPAHSASAVGVHPTFLYESLWNALGFAILHIYSKKRKNLPEGQIFALYMTWYGIGRAMIEGLRTDSLYLFGTGIRVSQLVAVVTAAAGVVMAAVTERGGKAAE